MKRFETIREVRKAGLTSEHFMRVLLAQGKLPGFYTGRTFRVNVPMLEKLLEDMSAQNAAGGEAANV